LEKREWLDILKLVGTAIIVVCGAMALLIFFDENLHLSSRWRLFAIGHVFAFVALLWYVRPLLKQLKPCLVILGWLIGHTAVAFALMATGFPVLYFLGALPFEAYLIIIIAKQFVVPVKKGTA